MRPNSYKLVEFCVENGALMGWARAHKHTDTPNGNQVQAAMVEAIMLEISEWFDFEESK